MLFGTTTKKPLKTFTHYAPLFAVFKNPFDSYDRCISGFEIVNWLILNTPFG